MNRNLTNATLIALALGGVAAIIALIAVIGLAFARQAQREAQAPILTITAAIQSLTEVPMDDMDAPTPMSAEEAANYPEPTGRIVYTCFVGGFDEICTINPDGTNQQQLTNIDATDWYASWGGESIVFSTRRDNNFEIYLMGADGGNPRRVTQNIGGNYAPELSPDGARIVFSTTVNGKQDVYTITPDGSDPRRITTSEADDFDPVWSPDGAQILFASNRTGTSELFIINADGTGLRQVTSGSNLQSGGRSDWSPDGSTIAFYAGEQGDKDIFTVPADCTRCGPGDFTQLTDGGNNKAPSYSPDGLWITFASSVASANDIWIMRADGTDWRQVTAETYAEWQPRWGD